MYQTGCHMNMKQNVENSFCSSFCMSPEQSSPSLSFGNIETSQIGLDYDALSNTRTAKAYRMIRIILLFVIKMKLLQQNLEQKLIIDKFYQHRI